MISPPDPLDRHFPLGDGTADRIAELPCPYCGEVNEVLLDPGSGARQEYVEDCPVCCRPWTVKVRWDSKGHAHVRLATEDEA